MFFHISKVNLGEVALFTPKVPENAYMFKEGNIPRVCVCPSAFQCLRGISGHDPLHSMDIIIGLPRDPETGWLIQPLVYAVHNKTNPYLPPHASDFRKNEERWFLQPVEMMRVGCIDLVALTQGRVIVCEFIQPVDPNLLSGIGKDVPIREKGNMHDYGGGPIFQDNE